MAVRDTGLFELESYRILPQSLRDSSLPEGAYWEQAGKEEQEWQEKKRTTEVCFHT